MVSETQSVMPLPAVAGWTEQTRMAEVAEFRAGVAANGGVIVSERRIRNTAFDRRGERTTWAFTVKW